jgi:hypothetical protein
VGFYEPTNGNFRYRWFNCGWTVPCQWIGCNGANGGVHEISGRISTTYPWPQICVEFDMNMVLHYVVFARLSYAGCGRRCRLFRY